MYELLLQADKALADGMLDQAERTYWQLIELDPSNAIAVAGLARVSLERGDERLARRLADRAMTIDPESVAARRIVDSLEHRGSDQPEADLPDLPMMAAQRLEALGRRRRASREPAEDADSPAETAADGSKAKQVKAPQAAITPPARHNTTRHEPHHAMPAGKRRFHAGELRAPTQDAYSAAEAAAAAEAADAIDAVEEPPEAGPGPVSGAEEDLGVDDGLRADDATATEESVTRRIAHVVDATELDAEELAAAETIEAGAVAADEGVALRVELVPDAIETEAAALEAAWVEAAQARWRLEVAQAHATDPEDAAVGTIEADAGESRADEFEAAQAETARIAPRQMLQAPSAEPDVPVERGAAPAPTLAGGAEGPSERDAEIDALREALAIVLGSESQDAQAEPGSAADAVLPGSIPSGRSRMVARQSEPAEPPEAAAPTQVAEPDGSTAPAEPKVPPRRKKGLFHRLGGH